MKRYQIFTYLDTRDLTYEKQLELKAELLKVLKNYGTSPELLNETGEEVEEIDIKYIEEL